MNIARFMNGLVDLLEVKAWDIQRDTQARGQSPTPAALRSAFSTIWAEAFLHLCLDLSRFTLHEHREQPTKRFVVAFTFSNRGVKINIGFIESIVTTRVRRGRSPAYVAKLELHIGLVARRNGAAHN